MEAVIDLGDTMVSDGPSIYDLLVTSIEENAKERQEYQREQNELHERAKKAREAIKRVSVGYERSVSDQQAVREARMVFWLWLANLVAHPNADNLKKTRAALCWLRQERLAASELAADIAEADEEAELIEVPVAEPLRTAIESLDPAEKIYGLIGCVKPKRPRTNTRKEKRAKAEKQRRDIYLARMRAAGMEALRKAFLEDEGDFITVEDFDKACKDFAKPPRQFDPKNKGYLCSRGNENLAFASRKVKVVKAKSEDDKKKKKGKKREEGRK